MLGAYAEESTIVSETGVTEAKTWKERQAALADVNNIESDESSRVMSIELKDISSEKKSALGIPYGTVTVAVADEDLLNGEEMTYTLSTSAAENGGTEHLMTVELPESLAPSLESLGLSGTLSEMTMKIYSSDKASTAKAPDADSTNLSSKEEIEEALNEMTGELANVILQFMFSEMM